MVRGEERRRAGESPVHEGWHDRALQVHSWALYDVAQGTTPGGKCWETFSEGPACT